MCVVWKERRRGGSLKLIMEIMRVRDILRGEKSGLHCLVVKQSFWFGNPAPRRILGSGGGRLVRARGQARGGHSFKSQLYPQLFEDQETRAE